MAVEFRNGTWFNEKNADRTLRFLEKYAIPFVMVDEPQTKTALPPIMAVTSPELAVVRFHGRRTETWRPRTSRSLNASATCTTTVSSASGCRACGSGCGRQERARADEQLLRQLRHHQRPRDRHPAPAERLVGERQVVLDHLPVLRSAIWAMAAALARHSSKAGWSPAVRDARAIAS